jgi:hypothetical protein
MITLLFLVVLGCAGAAAVVTPLATGSPNVGLQRIGWLVIAAALLLSAVLL